MITTWAQQLKTSLKNLKSLKKIKMSLQLQNKAENAQKMDILRMRYFSNNKTKKEEITFDQDEF